MTSKETRVDKKGDLPKQAEEDLSASEERFRITFQGHDAIMLLIDQETGTIQDANRAAVRFYGYSKELLCQMTIQEINTLSAEEVAHQRTLAIEKRRNYFIFPHRLADGEVKTVEVHSSPIAIRGKTLLFSIIHDISDRIQSEKALEDSEKKYRMIVETAKEGVWSMDGEYRTTFVNKSMADMLGYEPDEMLGRRVDSFMVPEDLGDHSKKMEARTHGQDSVYERQFLRKNGEALWTIVSACPLQDEQGNFAGSFAMFTNITDRKRADSALIASESKYRNIFENAMEGIYQATPEGRFITANAAMARMAGYDSPEELIDRIEDIGTQLYVHPEDRKRFLEIIKTKGMVNYFEVEFYKKNGSTFLVVINARAVKDEQEKTLYYEGIVEDITLRKQAEQKLLHSLDNLRKSFSTTIQVLVSAVETRDPYTSGHQIRSADLARAIATEMGLPMERIDGIRMAGSIHEIGKMSVPAEILVKPIKLSEIEYSLIKEHAKKGFEMLKDVESHWPLAEIVYQHHERMDGSGYPRGLKGEEILMEVRILAVADVVEAMASHRPYRPAIGLDAALAEIENNRGMLYDADAVEACLRLFREKGFQFEGTRL